MTPQIRMLVAPDAAELLSLRRAALLDSPLAFLASPEDDLAWSQGAVGELLMRSPESVVFGATAEHLVGTLGLRRDSHFKASHKAHIWGMFVLPEWRRRGLAQRLLSSAVTHARTLAGVASLHLCVGESASAARHLYENAGFKVWGTEPDALRFAGRAECDLHMRLLLHGIRPGDRPASVSSDGDPQESAAA